ncbi:hypothetical protein [Psychromonas sp. MME2]
MTLKKAIDVFEILRKKIASTSYKKDGVKINVTVSIGLFHGIKKDLNQ